ncbi:hypothetical protein NDU88_006308 [Pleurodeles waltl]|uniref:Uncharacterized protein n=1 Tax=Pleurodeles waltl TaxID=8319 RepID=A0AAV7TD14_PLEWA|nr:hypothetical protein NDU88_006308 [Pleurodeles waltl]
MARYRKTALQTGCGSPAHQEALDHMEEMVAAVNPEEIITGIQGQDSADYQETTHMQDQAAAMQALTSILQGLQQSVKEFTTAVRELSQHLAPQTFHCIHEYNQDPLRADLAAYHRDVAAILKNQQILLAAVLPLRPPQVAATGMSDSTSSNTEVCVAHSQPPPPRAEDPTHTSEDEDMEQITFTRKSTRKH